MTPTHLPTGFGAPFNTSLVDMLRHRASCQPDDLAYTFLEDGERPGSCWTWADVDCRARAIAASLADRVAPGERALLMFPPGLDFIAAFFGCLYGGIIAVPVAPPQRGPAHRSVDRVEAIGRAAAAAIVLTAKGTSNHSWPTQAMDSAWLDCSTVDLSLADRWKATAIDGNAVAFLQFTSGSTAAPRGVMVSHGNLLHNLAYGFDAGGADPNAVSVSWLPVTHDMGLIEGVLQPAFSGCPAYLMSPAAFLQRPVRWLNALSQYGGTRSGGPNFAYDLAVSRVAPDDRRRLDLSRWTAAYNGAEPVRAETMAAFAIAYEACGFHRSSFRPCYGLAEHTLLVSTDRWDGQADAGGTVSCGIPAFGTEVLIADPVTGEALSEGTQGEIRIAGPSVTAGYWNDAVETGRVFVTSPDAGTARRWLRTGDLGSLRDGKLYVSGRLKDLLIVRGAKHFPQDVERTAEHAHPALRRGGAIAVAIGSAVGGDRVVLVAEADERVVDASTADTVIAAIREAIAASHGLQLHGAALVRPGALPKTTSGKPRRYLCREAWNAGALSPIASWSCEPDFAAAAASR